MTTRRMRAGDTAHPLTADLFYDNGTKPEVTGATARLVVRPYGQLAPVIDAPATIADPTNATVSYAWQSGDTDAPGLFTIEWVVTYVDGSRQTFPTAGAETLIIDPPLYASPLGQAPPYPVTRWIEQARQHVYGTRRPAMNRVTHDVTPSDEEIVFDFPLDGGPNGVSAGSILSLRGEDLYVWAVDPTQKKVTVQRGMNGSMPQAHPRGSLAWIAPRVTDWQVLQALNADLDDLSAPANGIFRVGVVDRTFAPSLYGYDIASDMLESGIIDVRWHDNTPYQNWHRLVGFNVQANLPLADFPSGMALRLTEYGTPGQPFRIRYRAALRHVDYDDDAALTGLPASAYDLPPLGAAIRLMSGEEVARNDTRAQGDPRRAAEVPPGAVINSYRGLQALRASRIAAEAGRLASVNPLTLVRR